MYSTVTAGDCNEPLKLVYLHTVIDVKTTNQKLIIALNVQQPRQ